MKGIRLCHLRALVQNLKGSLFGQPVCNGVGSDKPPVFSKDSLFTDVGFDFFEAPDEVSGGSGQVLP